MKKMDRKGYLTVDVILASVVAVSIAVFLMEITIKLVNITNDEYVSTDLMTDKALIIKNIKSLIEDDIKNNSIKSVTCDDNSCTIHYLNYDKILKIDNNKVYYSDNYYSDNYSKELDSSLTNILLNYYTENDYYDFYITADNKFSKESYRIDVIVKNS